MVPYNQYCEEKLNHQEFEWNVCKLNDRQMFENWDTGM